MMNEKFWQWLAKRMPKKLVYFCGIRLWAFATCGKYGDQEVPALKMDDALKRWEDR